MKSSPRDSRGRFERPEDGVRAIRTCQTCGTRFSATRENESCPVCMLRKAVAGRVESGGSLAQDTVSPPPEDAASRFEHYEIVLNEEGKPLELGRGAMGVTYKAFDVDLRCPVTLKVISEKYLGDEAARVRFLREARAAASVRHPNVASVFHLGRRGQDYFYAMEFVEGETLDNLIKRSGPLEVKCALDITKQVAAGLAAVHKKKLVHRDIKPSNIMVSLEEEGALTAKIIDLGLAKAVDESGAQTTISASGAFAGTPEFASPEQICRRRGGYPFGSLLAWCFALADADRARALSGKCRRGDVSTSARCVAAGKTPRPSAPGGQPHRSSCSIRIRLDVFRRPLNFSRRWRRQLAP